MSSATIATPRRHQQVHDLGHRARRDAVVRTGAAGLLWAALLLVAYWWISDGGLRGLWDPATALESAGRLSGLAASVLLLAQVLLMARLPVLEQAFGQDRLARIHRVVGFTSFSLMGLHVVTIVWGYAGARLLSTPATAWDLATAYPGMLLAVAATAALCLVVATSLRAARARLRYESWHLLHLYAYLGAGLALPHQLWTGQQFISSPARTVFWWAAWGACTAALLAWRLGVPVVVNLRHRLRVTSVVDEGHDVWSVYVTGRSLDRLPVEAGQFLNWRFVAGPGWTRAHPYSLSAAPDGRSLRITVHGVGDGSHGVRRLRPGTRALVEGPFGRLSARARRRRKLAFIGAGVGVTPLRALAEGMEYDAGTAVYLERFHDQPLFAAEVNALACERGLEVLRIGGRRRSPDSWLGVGAGTASDLAALRHWVPDIAERDVYVCGPLGWTVLVRRTLIAAGLPDDHLHLETFSW